MSNNMARDDPSVTVLDGVDTHKPPHFAVAINGLDARRAAPRAPAAQAGGAELLSWARPLGTIGACGIEGPGCYGVNLASFVPRQGLRVVAVNHCASDATTARTTDAEPAIPKTADGAAELVRA